MTVLLRAEGLQSARAGPFTIALTAGACLAITGPSGAGKSLFLRMLADLDPHEGEAWLEGAPRSAMAAPAWRSRVGYVAAENGWWMDQVGAHFDTAPLRLLGEMGLAADILDRPVALCSTGERQRLSLARSLSRDPVVLLLDEPTGALDQASVIAVESVLQTRLRLGVAIVMVTHDPAQARRLGTQHARIEAGRML